MAETSRLGRKLLCIGWLASALGCADASSDDAGRVGAGAAVTMMAPAAVVDMDAPCVLRTQQLTVTSAARMPAPAGSRVVYSLEVSNRDDPSCEPAMFLASVSGALEDHGLHAETEATTSTQIVGGASASIEFAIASADAADPGSTPFSFFVRRLTSASGVGTTPGEEFAVPLTAEAPARFEVAAPDSCYVSAQRELLVTDLGVVEDPVRTAPGGAWTFGHLLEQLAESPDVAADMAERMVRTLGSKQTINGFDVPARGDAQSVLLAPWPRTAAGKLDLARAPLRLLAIVHRLDLAQAAQHTAGDGRFVFGALGPGGRPLLFTLIFEYTLPAATPAELRAWQDAVHTLQTPAFPSQDYNVRLAALTERYAGRGAAPDRPGGSALLRIRTNDGELSRDGSWQLREFQLSTETGRLEPATLALTPDDTWNGSAELAKYINENHDLVLREQHDVPARFDGAPFQGGAVLNLGNRWNAPGIDDPEARHKFSLNTCDGCHGGETQTGFFHVSPRQAGEPSRLSKFLTGETVRDPITKQPRTLSELYRRRQLLESIVCSSTR